MSEVKTHPIQKSINLKQGRCPQIVTMRAYEVYCEVFGGQEALVTGSCRGGFGNGELIALLYARSFPKEMWHMKYKEAFKGQENL